MIIRGRAYRRKRKLEIGRKIFRYYQGYDPITRSGFTKSLFQDLHTSELADRRLMNMYSKMRKPCSCWMCGNPRRHFRGKASLTLQELSDIEINCLLDQAA